MSGLFVCWSVTSLCHTNGHIETMPAREINPFTALTRIRSQFLRTQWSTSNHSEWTRLRIRPLSHRGWHTVCLEELKKVRFGFEGAPIARFLPNLLNLQSCNYEIRCQICFVHVNGAIIHIYASVTVACGVLSACSVFTGYSVVNVCVTCSVRSVPKRCVYRCIRMAGKSGIKTGVCGPRATL